MVFEGFNGTIELDDEALIIVRSGMTAKAAGLSGPPQRIPLEAISDVGFKDASRLVNGWLQVGIGGRELRSLGVGSMASDANTVVFRHKHREAFAELRDKLTAIIETNRQSGVDPSEITIEPGGREAKKTQELAAQTQGLAAKLGGEDAREDIVQAAARMGWKFGGKRELKKLPQHLLDGETVRIIAQGTYESGQGIVVLTDRRVLFLHHGLTGDRKEDFALRSITSVQTKSGPVTGEVRLFASGNEAVIKGIVKADAAVLADAIRDEVAAALHAPSSASAGMVPPDPADQLRKLAELREAGIVTDAEFEAKKQELLDRM